MSLSLITSTPEAEGCETTGKGKRRVIQPLDIEHLLATSCVEFRSTGRATVTGCAQESEQVLDIPNGLILDNSKTREKAFRSD